MTQQEVDERNRRVTDRNQRREGKRLSRGRRDFKRQTQVGGIALLPRGPRRVETLQELRARKEQEFQARQKPVKARRKGKANSPTDAQLTKPRTRAKRATRVREVRSE